MIEQIQVSFPKVESKTEPEMAQQLQTIHQLTATLLQNHFVAIGNLNTQVKSLQAEVAALKAAK